MRTQPRGDGSYIIKPGRPVQSSSTLTVKEVAQRMGRSADTVLRLDAAGFLKGGKLSPRKTFIFAASMEAHLKRTRDPKFWERWRAKRQGRAHK